MELSRLSSLALCWDGYKLRADRVQDCGEAEMKFLSIVAFLMLLAGCAGDSAPRIDGKQGLITISWMMRNAI